MSDYASLIRPTVAWSGPTWCGPFVIRHNAPNGHPEQREGSAFHSRSVVEREIPRFARNDTDGVVSPLFCHRMSEYLQK